MTMPTIEVVNVMIAVNRQLDADGCEQTPHNQLVYLQQGIDNVSAGARTPDDHELLDAIILAYDFTLCAIIGIQL